VAQQTLYKAYRGPASGLPTLEAGQLGWTTDTHILYVGTGTGNLAVLMASQATAAGLALMDDANAAAQIATLGLDADLVSIDLNIIDLAINLETLKGAILTGVVANIFVETFQTLGDITLSHGTYDAGNKKVYL
jgi:hypothetical protein